MDDPFSSNCCSIAQHLLPAFSTIFHHGVALAMAAPRTGNYCLWLPLVCMGWVHLRSSQIIWGFVKTLILIKCFFFPDVIDFFLLSSLIVFSGYWGIMEYWTNRCRIIIFSHLRSLHISTWYYNILQNHPTYTPVGCSPKRTNARVLVSTQRWRRNSVHGGGHRPCASLRDWSTAAKGPCIFWSAFDIIWCGIMWYLFCCLHIVNTDDDEDHLVPV